MFRLAFAVATSVSVLAACTTIGPNYRAPQPGVDATLVNTALPGFDNADPIAVFWKGFNDPRLDRLIDQALTANQDIRIADARLQEARGVRRDAEGERFPTLIANGGYNFQQFSTAEFPGTRDARNRDAFFSRLEPSWEIDFFGRVRRSIEARVAELGAAEAGVYAAQIAVISELARSYFELRGWQRQLAVARAAAANQERTLKLTTAREQAGRGTELDIARARNLLETTLAAGPQIDLGLQRARYRIAVLIGRQPNALASELADAIAAAPLPELVSVGTPEQLLRRRPDILIAERQLAAATARIGVATGDLYPRVTIAGRFGLQARSLSNLVDTDSITYALGPSIQWAAFDLSRVRARIASSESRAEAALANFEQTVNRALEETEGAVLAYARTRERQASLARALSASERAAELARLRFENGVSDLLTVLDAERQRLAAQNEVVAGETATATTLVALYRALGGGWRPIE